MHAPAVGSLEALLSAIPDPRGRKGLRHPLAAMLAATVCGILTGACGCEAVGGTDHDRAGQRPLSTESGGSTIGGQAEYPPALLAKLLAESELDRTVMGVHQTSKHLR